ncbi:MAG: CDP-diacylglycerol--glycerol-3-phosphate 3-phosphatidyltransferase, partial [Pseudomonadota bacterium]
VSGLREFLGSKAGTLKVTRLAKWKTTAQMVAIAVLFANGAVEHYFGMLTLGMGDDLTRQVIDGTEEDIYGVRRLYTLWDITWYGGIILLWAAGVLTLITGADYFLKAWKHLKEDGA